MSLSNNTNFHPNTILLLGIPGMEAIHTWLSMPFCFVYLSALLGIFAILFIIRTDSNLHEPMLFFLCMLSVTDMIISTTVRPKMLSIFWFHGSEIYFEALVQVFLIHSLCNMASGFILAMAFDRYVAICDPLRHSTILTHGIIKNLGLAIVFRGVLLFSPQPFMLRWLPYCRTNIIPHTYYEFMALIKLAYAERPESTESTPDCCLLHWRFRFLIDPMLLGSRPEAHVDPVCVISVAYTPAFFFFLTHRFGHHMAPHTHIFVANIYLLVPPMVNPLIYGIRTKRIRDRVLQVWTSHQF
ncbi:unnamed protein product [Nyctereutes procyonoides]|uniref:Olfactory receptor n=1 Tax=Nyctereutes procyonoides TaxID=34880 RepID=A0A811Y803_NYCPR|nr:unnamed protein product [Nyctereutes procyonoides]